MLKVVFSEETIAQDNLAYRLEGKVEPRLFNLGEGEVRINGVALKKNESFLAGFVGAESVGTLRIQFTDQEAQNRVVCFYGTVQPEQQGGDCR